jgi:biotin-dependent carboxylase-like uncharacterized protein
MNPVLVVENCSVGASIQDLGRVGWRRHGISTAGAMDQLSLAVANLLVGNPPSTAAIEVSLAGARFRLMGGSALLAVAGPGVALRVNGRSFPERQSIRAKHDDIIEVTAPRNAVHGYIAMAGGLALASVMGSLSTHQRSGLGPPALDVGMCLRLHSGPLPAPLMLDEIPLHDGGPIRILPGPQDDWFAPDTLEALTNAEWRIDPRSDRMGRFLEGPRLKPLPGSMVSDGIVQGGIQIPPSGQPIILMRDCQTTGGYPRIATVISADMDRLAQIPAGSELRFVEVDAARALAAARSRAAQMLSLSPRLADTDDVSRLLKLNLVSGVVDAGLWARKDE